MEKGDKLRAFHFIRLLSEEHDVHLFALSDRKVSDTDYKAVAEYCDKIEVVHFSGWSIFKGLVASLFRGLPFQVGYFWNRKAARGISAMIKQEEPDLIFCQLVRVAEYVKDIPVRKVIDYQDALSLNMRRRAAVSKGIKKLVFAREARLLSLYENSVFNKFDYRIIISEPDKEALTHPDKGEIVVIPNGVDHDFFIPDESAEKRYDVVFTGNMSYAPNVEGAIWLAKEIFPLVKKSMPHLTLLLAGASPVSSVKALESDDITVTGWIPDIRDAYRQSKVFIAPMLTGSGLQNKLLEAMAMKLPCITTNLANASLMAENNREIIVADSADEIAAAIVKLLKDKQFAEEIAVSAYRMVRSKFCWNSVIEKFNYLITK